MAVTIGSSGVTFNDATVQTTAGGPAHLTQLGTATATPVNGSTWNCSVTVGSNWTTDYKYLVWTARGTLRANTNSNLVFTFNDLTGSNYYNYTSVTNADVNTQTSTKLITRAFIATNQLQVHGHGFIIGARDGGATYPGFPMLTGTMVNSFNSEFISGAMRGDTSGRTTDITSVQLGGSGSSFESSGFLTFTIFGAKG